MTTGTMLLDVMEKVGGTVLQWLLTVWKIQIWQSSWNCRQRKPLPIVGSMACTWCDEPQKEYKPEIVKGLMELFANQNKDYIYPKANYAKVEDAIKKHQKT